MAYDQADELRHLVRHATIDSRAAGRRPLMHLIIGGRESAGTTTIASGIAAVMAQQGRRVVLIHASPVAEASPDGRLTLADILHGRATVRGVLQPGPGTLRSVPPPVAATMPRVVSREQSARLVAQIHELGPSVDAVLVDLGSGASSLARNLWNEAEVITLVTMPDRAAVMDSYAVLKTLTTKSHGGVHLLVNRAEDEAIVRDVWTRLARAAHRFLGLPIRHAFGVPDSTNAEDHLMSHRLRQFVTAIDCPPRVTVRTTPSIAVAGGGDSVG